MDEVARPDHCIDILRQTIDAQFFIQQYTQTRIKTISTISTIVQLGW